MTTLTVEPFFKSRLARVKPLMLYLNTTTKDRLCVWKKKVKEEEKKKEEEEEEEKEGDLLVKSRL